ncbi:uncharacterized protein [Primulina eburnea]|uniref:uncharacterized protein n=1 Tax=Primulina eburnea TaxID=1245227 RepID=UPI003C6CA936
MDSDRCFIGYRRMEEEELSLPVMRQMCDVYVRALYPGSFGGSNTYLADEALYAFGDNPELALNAFNSAKGRNFKLVKFIKLNRINTLFNSMTFEAKEDGSDECLLFRAVVNLIGTDNVLLCEIRDGDESKDLGDDILSFVRPSYHYICFKHERGECHSTDGSLGGKCDYAVGSSRGECICVVCSAHKDKRMTTIK